MWIFPSLPGALPVIPARNLQIYSTRPLCSRPASARKPWKWPSSRKARDKVPWGRERRSLAMDQRRQALHRLARSRPCPGQCFCSNTPTRSTRSPSSRAASLWVQPCSCRRKIAESPAQGDARYHLCHDGGRIAEEIVSNDISSGAAGDIQQATNYGPRDDLQLGHEPKNSAWSQYGNDNEFVFLGPRHDAQQRNTAS